MRDLYTPALAARLFDAPWAIEPAKLGAFAAVMRMSLGGTQPTADRFESLKTAAEPAYAVVNGAGVIPVTGTLVHRASWVDDFLGFTSYEKLSNQLSQALADDRVNSILLRIDSPGGEVSGLFDFADRVSAARGVKPVMAFAEGAACSAAYLIGSAAEQFYVSQASPVGSIGVRMLHVDQSKAEESAGFSVREIFAGQRKVDGSPHGPLTDEAAAALQAHVDEYYELFTAAVARNRGLLQADVKGTEAGVYVGQSAVRQRLADGVRTLDQVLSMPAPAQAQRTLSDGGGRMEKLETVAALASAYPDLTAQIRDEAVKAERERISEIFGLAPAGMDDEARRLAFAEPCSADQAARKFLAVQKANKDTQLNGFLADAPKALPPSAPAPEGAGEQTVGERLMVEAVERHNKFEAERRGQLSVIPGGRN